MRLAGGALGLQGERKKAYPNCIECGGGRSYFFDETKAVICCRISFCSCLIVSSLVKSFASGSLFGCEVKAEVELPVKMFRGLKLNLNKDLTNLKGAISVTNKPFSIKGLKALKNCHTRKMINSIMIML